MAGYHLGWTDEDGTPGSFARGKQLRPTLCLLACETVSGDYRAALPAAAALELLHNFSLIHDDVMDRDVLRRGRPTVWKLWGTSQAINTGDLLLTRSFEALTRLPEEVAVDAIAILANACATMIEGQSLDLLFEDRDEVTVDEYIDMIGRKTAALVAASLQLGARSGNAAPATERDLAELGRLMGVSFQLGDDILGTWGDSAVTGKPVGQDLLRKKKTLPVLLLAGAASQQDRGQLQEFLAEPDPSNESPSGILAIMSELGIRPEAQALAREYSIRALGVLGKLPDGIGKRAEFAALIDFFAAREV